MLSKIDDNHQLIQLFEKHATEMGKMTLWLKPGLHIVLKIA